MYQDKNSYMKESKRSQMSLQRASLIKYTNYCPINEIKDT